MYDKQYKAKTPAIILENPKYPHNVARIIRTASAFGVEQVWYTGTRMDIDLEKYEGKRRKRLPREERMKGYQDVELINFDYPFDFFAKIGAQPVCVEINKGYRNLVKWGHPRKPVYVFGPEDGSISKAFRALCHHFVYIPSYHCLNLSTAVAVMLYDYTSKRYWEDGTMPELREDRGYYVGAED